MRKELPKPPTSGRKPGKALPKIECSPASARLPEAPLHKAKLPISQWFNRHLWQIITPLGIVLFLVSVVFIFAKNSKSKPAIIDQTLAPSETANVVPVPASLDQTIQPSATGVMSEASKLAAAGTPEQNEINEILAKPISKAHAWDLQIAHTRPLASNVLATPSPVFSDDSESVMFAQKDGNSVNLVIVRLQDRRVLSSWPLSAEPEILAWSQDGKHLAYKAADGQMHVVDWTTRKDVSFKTDFGEGNYYNRTSRLEWMGDDKIVIVNEEYSHASILNLDDLSITEVEIPERKVNHDESKTQEGYRNIWHGDQHFRRIINLPEGHTHCRIYQADNGTGYRNIYGSDQGPFLFIGEKQKPYEHAILFQYFAQYPFYASPDLRHVLVLSDGLLTQHIIGFRDAPEMRFRIDLDSRNLTDIDDPQAFRKLHDNGVPFWGTVFAPLINPINGKVIAPDRENPKGTVWVSKWYDGYATVSTGTELAPLLVGDIVEEIRSEQWGMFGNHTLGLKDKWFFLQKMETASLPLEDVTTAETAPPKTQTAVIEPQNSSTPSVEDSASATESSIIRKDGWQPEQLRTEMLNPLVRDTAAPASSPDPPGLLGERFPQTRTRLISPDDIAGWSADRIRYAINEMYARHGADFTKQEIKQAFVRFNWYQPEPGKSYDAAEADFSDIERHNVKVLGDMRAGARAEGSKDRPDSSRISSLDVDLAIVDAYLRDGKAGMKNLRVAVKSRRGSIINVNGVKIYIYFYEENQNGDVLITDSKVATQWVSPPIDWAANGPELLDGQYILPDSPGRNYHGFVVAVYYKNMLQDFRSEPAHLAKTFPLPTHLK